MLFYAAVFEPHNLRPTYWQFMNRISYNRFVCYTNIFSSASLFRVHNLSEICWFIGVATFYRFDDCLRIWTDTTNLRCTSSGIRYAKNIAGWVQISFSLTIGEGNVKLVLNNCDTSNYCILTSRYGIPILSHLFDFSMMFIVLIALQIYVRKPKNLRHVRSAEFQTVWRLLATPRSGSCLQGTPGAHPYLGAFLRMQCTTRKLYRVT